MRIKKESFLPGFNQRSASISHGGDLRQEKRKIRRPFDPKEALHVVLRSSVAKGEQSMLHPKNSRAIHDFSHRLAERWGVRVYRYANVGNHLHFLVKAPSRAVWRRRFIRELAGGIPVLVTGAKKGLALSRNKSGRGFWDGLVFTRIVHFGRDFENLARYIIKNLFEASGVPVKKLMERGYRILSINRDGLIRGAPA
jgi:REP element-mobilizing transposase RayT